MNVVRDVRRGDVSSVLPMIAKKARRAWKGLPTHTREWVTLEDLIADGVSFTATQAVTHFNNKRNTKFSTYLFAALDNYYIYRTAPYRTEGRDESKTVSFDRKTVNAVSRHDPWMDGIPLSQYLSVAKREKSPEQTIVQKIDIERQFIRIYQDSTINLRRYLVRWFFQPQRQYRTTPCRELTQAKKEFRILAVRHEFSTEMCRTLLGSQTLRISLSATILRKFCTIHHVKRDGTLSYVEKHLHVIIA